MEERTEKDEKESKLRNLIKRELKGFLKDNNWVRKQTKMNRKAAGNEEIEL